jgi:uncharacterized protein (DUF885 family)
VHGVELVKQYFIPYRNVAQMIYAGLRALLDDQIAATRRPTALVRLKRYTGIQKGYSPLTLLAERQTRERMNTPGLLGPSTAQVEKDLDNTQFFIQGIGQLFEKYKIAGYQEAYAKLKEQVAAYDNFLRKEVLPRSRTDFRLPREMYDFSLKQYGVDIGGAELAAMAHSAFVQIQAEMEALAAQVAKQKGLHVTDYRDVIRQLKQDQLVGEQILPHYQKRIAQIEEIIRREDLVTLPVRPARMILASPAETAQQPAPHMRPPRLIGNTGEGGEFVLPLNIPGAAQRYDDFTFAAASWTLISHEVRPGHEMQFAAIVEKGVLRRARFSLSTARTSKVGVCIPNSSCGLTCRSTGN